VARTLARLDLEPIILHEQPNRGRTIIEKFEDYADVSFAVVLLTPDDMGYAASEDPSTARARARQNVILELGFFLGRLGRERVVALYTGDETFEKPSDYEGVLFIPVDTSGRWQFDLVRELAACGIEVDANKIVSP
jgi:predicted nucleotide-binding protein